MAVTMRARRDDRRSMYRSLERRLSELPAPERGRPSLVPAARRAKRDSVWDALRARVDPVRFRPKLAGDIEMKFFELRWGNDYAMIANPRDLVHYRLEPWEYELLALMDGTRTVEQIVIEAMRGSGDLELSGVTDLVVQLRIGNFLDEPFHDADEALLHALEPKRSAGRRVADFLRTLRLDWNGADGFVRYLYDHGLKAMFSPAALTVSALVTVAGFALFVSTVTTGRIEFTGRGAAVQGLILVLLNYFMIFVHELGHAATLLHMGRRVKSAGFLIYFGSPAFFVESSDSLMLDRGHRIGQSFAGPYAQGVVAGIAAAVAWALPETPIGSLLYKVAVLNYLMIFMNLIPMLELDGYWILSDAIQVPDLRPRSLSFVRHDLFHKLFKRERFTKQELGLAAYGIVGVAFTIFSLYTSAFFWWHLFGELFISLWKGGTAGRAVLIALTLILGGPLVRGGINMIRWAGRRIEAFVQQIRFRLETSWRVEAGELIDTLPLFDDVPVETLNELAGGAALKTVAAGQPVVRQGDRATAFYVIRKGTFLVLEEDPTTGDEQVLRRLHRGDSFGELAVIQGTPRRASVRAKDEGQVFEIDKSSFVRLLAKMTKVPEFAPTFQDMTELREMPPFAHLEQSQLGELLKHGDWVSYGPGEIIVKRGDVADTFYAIGSGQVDVLEGRKLLATMGPQEYFGEVGLLLGVRRTATVRARTPVRLYRLDRTGFNRLVRSSFRRGTLAPHARSGRSATH